MSSIGRLQRQQQQPKGFFVQSHHDLVERLLFALFSSLLLLLLFSPMGETWVPSAASLFSTAASTQVLGVCSNFYLQKISPPLLKQLLLLQLFDVLPLLLPPLLSFSSIMINIIRRMRMATTGRIMACSVLPKRSLSIVLFVRGGG